MSDVTEAFERYKRVEGELRKVLDWLEEYQGKIQVEVKVFATADGGNSKPPRIFDELLRSYTAAYAYNAHEEIIRQLQQDFSEAEEDFLAKIKNITVDKKLSTAFEDRVNRLFPRQ